MGSESSHPTIRVDDEDAASTGPPCPPRAERSFDDRVVVAEIDALHERFNDAEGSGRLDILEVRKFLSEMHSLDLVKGVDDDAVLRTRRIVARHAKSLVDESVIAPVTLELWRRHFRSVFAELDAKVLVAAAAQTPPRSKMRKSRAVSTGHELFLHALQHGGGSTRGLRRSFSSSRVGGAPPLPPPTAAAAAAEAALVNSPLLYCVDRKGARRPCASQVLRSGDAQDIERSLPVWQQNHDWRRIYSLQEHGCDVRTFINCVEASSPTLIVLLSEHGEVCGAYASEAWRSTVHFCGDGETFLFSCARRQARSSSSSSSSSSRRGSGGGAERSFRAFRW